MCLLAEVLLVEFLIVRVLPLVVLLALEGEMALVAFELLEKEGEDSTGIGDTEGGEAVATLWRFACALVFLVPFLFG